MITIWTLEAAHASRTEGKKAWPGEFVSVQQRGLDEPTLVGRNSCRHIRVICRIFCTTPANSLRRTNTAALFARTANCWPIFEQAL